MAVWRCGSVAVAVWRCGGVAVWRCGGGVVVVAVVAADIFGCDGLPKVAHVLRLPQQLRHQPPRPRAELFRVGVGFVSDVQVEFQSYAGHKVGAQVFCGRGSTLQKALQAVEQKWQVDIEAVRGVRDGGGGVGVEHVHEGVPLLVLPRHGGHGGQGGEKPVPNWRQYVREFAHERVRGGEPLFPVAQEAAQRPGLRRLVVRRKGDLRHHQLPNGARSKPLSHTQCELGRQRPGMGIAAAAAVAAGVCVCG